MKRDERLTVLKNVRRLMRGRRRNVQNWVLVMDVFAVGSTTAHKICGELGIDPESMDA